MRLLTDEDKPPYPHPCYLNEDVDDAREVCQTLGIPHYVFDFRREFKELVIEYFLKEYAQGRTPNPCLICNKEIKFRLLLNKALALGADFLATGHYARITFYDGQFRLLKGIDKMKDQSYFLFSLGQRELSYLLFPLGDYRKEEVRLLAKEKGLRVADKRESQDLCFSVPRLSIPGEIIDTRGKVLGKHPGISFFTIGQRRGLGLTSPRPLYVLKIDPINNRLIVGEEEELYSQRLLAHPVYWVSGKAPSDSIEVMAKVRYRSVEERATVYPQGEWALVQFHQPQRAITPGQAVVFYKGDEVLGGGFILRAD